MKMRSQRRNKKPRQNSFLLVTVSQVFLCALMLFSAYVLSNTLGMTELKPAFSDLLTTETQAMEVFSTVRANGVYNPASSFVQRIQAVMEAAFGKKGGAYTPPASVLPERVIMSFAAERPAEGYVSSGFGLRIHPILGKQDFHTGIDIAAPEHTPVVAAYHGVVSDIGVSTVYGNYVLLDHGNFTTKYAHCTSIEVKVGMVMRRGELIARVGSTGLSTGPHLHFEVRMSDRAIDPMYCFGNGAV